MLAPGEKGAWSRYCNWTIRILSLLWVVGGVVGADADGSGNGDEGASQSVSQAQVQVHSQTGSVCLVRHEGIIEWPVCVEDVGSVTAAAIAASSSTTTSTTTTAASETGTETHSTNTAIQDQDLDTDSPLDNSHFLSFEDWKKQNLAKVGQSTENVGGSRRAGAAAAGKEPRGRPTGINNALDSLGDDSEIELDFPGFGTDSSDSARPTDWDHTAAGAASVTAELRADGARGSNAGGGGGGREGGGAGGGGGRGGKNEREVASDGDSPSYEVIRTGPSRRRDAGTTCKERFNYASFDCAATVLKTNSECTGSSSVLIENKDSYMLNECRANNKFLILELCDDILVDTVVLANYEFFSSIFHTFRVSVSDRYPAKPDQWKELGVYEARNTREVQAFAVENPLIWARYLKIEFLTHYGHEFYCPLSLIRVHGTTMMEEYKHDGEVGRVDEEIVDMALESASEADIEPSSVDPSATGVETAVSEGGGTPSREAWFHRGKEIETLLLEGPFHSHADTCGIHASSAEDVWFGEAAQSADITVPVESQNASVVVDEAVTGSGADVPSKEAVVGVDTRTSGVSNGTGAATVETETVQQQQQQQNVTSEMGVSREDTSSEPAKLTTTAPTTMTTTQPPSSNPTTQESFFKSVNKRLQMLETNSTLSLLYIEEQSRILRDAFNKVEKRQLAKTSTFLEQLNQTVIDELKQFREQYDQVWKTVVFEFEHQRLHHHREMYALSGQLGILADELVFQKRVAVVQSIMVVVCFGLILFSTSGVVPSRSGGGGYLDFNMIPSRRSYSLRSSSPRTFGSPTASASASASASPSSTRPASLFRTHLHDERGNEHDHSHRRNLSDDSQGPAIAYSPPTPTSNQSSDDPRPEGEGADAGDSLTMPSVEPHVRSHSSPPALNAGEDGTESPT